MKLKTNASFHSTITVDDVTYRIIHTGERSPIFKTSMIIAQRDGVYYRITPKHSPVTQEIRYEVIRTTIGSLTRMGEACLEAAELIREGV